MRFTIQFVAGILWLCSSSAYWQACAQGDSGCMGFVGPVVYRGEHSEQIIDMNGDGRLDIVAAGHAGQSNGVFLTLALSDGSYRDPIFRGMGRTVSDLICADVDGDGDLDLVSADWYTKSVHIRRNNGNATVQPIESLVVSSDAQQVVACDFDHDGRDEIVVRFQVYNQVQIVEVSETTDELVSREVVIFGPGDVVMDIAFGDVDGDLSVDIVAVLMDGRVMLLRNDGTGFFGLPELIAEEPAGDLFELEVEDFDQDGLVDFAVSHSVRGTVRVYQQTPDELFVEVVELDIVDFSGVITAADVNSDSRPDLLVRGRDGSDGGELYVYMQGTGPLIEFDDPQFFIYRRAIHDTVAIGDLNGDGLVDLLAEGHVAYGDPVTLFDTGRQLIEERVSGHLSGGDPVWGRVDIDLDGDDDLYRYYRSLNSDYELALYSNNGMGGFDLSNRLSSGVDGTFEFYETLQFVDVDSDGAPDLVGVNTVASNSFIDVYLGDGAFGFEFSETVETQHEQVSVVDIDGDGLLDLVGAEGYRDGPRSVYWYRGVGLLSYDEPVMTTQESHGDNYFTVVYKVEDINSDGLLDIVFLAEADRLVIAPQIAPGVFGQERVMSFPYQIESFRLVDLDDDTDLDIVMTTTNPLPGKLRATRNIGDYQFQGGWVSEDSIDGNSGSRVISGDFNQDGIPDLVATSRQATSTSYWVYLGAGDLEFTLDGEYLHITTAGPLQAFDFDSDGDLDLVGGGGERITAIENFCSSPIVPCGPDLNHDGELNFFDVSVFIATQFDYNDDGAFNFFDVSAFIEDFLAGCP